MARYLFEKEPLTCASLEQELGLNKGDIANLTIYPEGVVEVESKVSLSPTTQSNLRAILDKQGLLRGKKREQEI